MKYICLILSWPVCVIHRFWNNLPAHKVYWFLMDVRKPDGSLMQQDIQWYIADTGNMVSVSLILLSFYLFAKRMPRLRLLVGTIFWISISDLLHYYLCFKQMEMVVYLQGLAMIIATLILFVWKEPLRSGRQS